jgi:NAD(P)-dependent dehydrogenase (short-subunit alcohol dehydrogenase family)
MDLEDKSKMNLREENWDERAVLITGGSSGVGKATASKFLSEGAMVLITARNQQRLQATVEELSNLSGNITYMVSDIRKVEDCEAAIAQAIKRYGRLDVLVNSAGVWVEGDSSKSREEEWDLVVDTNLKGTYFMCSRAIPELRRTRGCIINVSSDAGVVGNQGAAIYCASKGGVNLLTKSLAIELAEDLVRVNAVCPADIATPMAWNAAKEYGGADQEAYYRGLLSKYPQAGNARLIEPGEVASLIFYLASRQAQAITGATICIDFGLTAGY